ncbi:hypothetical protein [Chitinilyticum piscinae]|uniref:Uncharacterized protein n=1 Tax=Chitinilyticum piscinae TaxID=2866724 RepID=A0A8J7FRZ5_9NEIS|nr:hypothetical protein [Chitinilyticum piscinae]MBE9609756.1 hypothetical protein [Chitinilyticum piscinae]
MIAPVSLRERVLAELAAAFANVPRPVRFTAASHPGDDEREAREALLQRRGRDKLDLDDIAHPWDDPILSCTAPAKAWLLPTLARLALAQAPGGDWYAAQLVQVLYSGFSQNELYCFCNAAQRQAVAGWLGYLLEQEASRIDAHGLADEVLRCHALWSARPA